MYVCMKGKKKKKRKERTPFIMNNIFLSLSNYLNNRTDNLPTTPSHFPLPPSPQQANLFFFFFFRQKGNSQQSITLPPILLLPSAPHLRTAPARYIRIQPIFPPNQPRVERCDKYSSTARHPPLSYHPTAFGDPSPAYSMHP